VVLSITAWPALSSGATSGANGSHDPSRMIESEGRVYIYSTGGGAKSSSDGLVWRDEPAPPWNRALLPGNQGLWAPDGLYLNGRYYLYGAMWTAAKASAVILTTSPTLNPTSSDYKWTDEGVVISGPVGVTHSVIDPGPVLDAEGNLWLVWGGGYPFPTTVDSIFVTRLDNNTGLPLTSDPGWNPPDSPGYPIEQGHKEGPYVQYHAGFYYLFYQTGSCCSGAASTYTIHVARSQAITGPYSGDRIFYAGASGIHGPGHIGIYSACGFERFTYHYYPDTGGSVVGENELVWDASGWPGVGAQSTTALRLCGANGTGGVGGGGGGSAGTAGSAGASAGGGRGDAGGGAAGEATDSGRDDPTGTGGNGGTSGMPGGGGGTGSVGREANGSTGGCSCNVLASDSLGGLSGSLLFVALASLGARRRQRHWRCPPSNPAALETIGRSSPRH
jgi:hypothetical protein